MKLKIARPYGIKDEITARKVGNFAVHKALGQPGDCYSISDPITGRRFPVNFCCEATAIRTARQLRVLDLNIPFPKKLQHRQYAFSELPARWQKQMKLAHGIVMAATCEKHERAVWKTV